MADQIATISGKFYRYAFNETDTINQGQAFGYIQFITPVDQCANVTGSIKTLSPDQSKVIGGAVICTITPTVSTPLSVVNPVV